MKRVVVFVMVARAAVAAVASAQPAAPRPGLLVGIGVVGAAARSDTAKLGPSALGAATLGFAPTSMTAISISLDLGTSFAEGKTSMLGHFDLGGRAYLRRARLAPFMEIGLTSRIAD